MTTNLDKVREARSHLQYHHENGECPKCGYDTVLVYDFVPQILKDLGEFPTPYRCADRDCGRFFYNHRRQDDHGDDERRHSQGF